MVAAKPDCTGQKFGRLTVLSKGPVVRDPKGHSRSLWNLRCDCGNEIQLARCNFDRKSNGQKSCGCLVRLGLQVKRQPTDIKGQRFGELVAESIIPGIHIYDRPVWLLRCDCGSTRRMTLKYINWLLTHGYRVNCGADIHQPCVHYPPTPSPYPADAAAIAQKYLRLAKWHGPLNDSEIEDRCMDRLLRAAWIITYRRISGESISAIHEERLIKKHIRFARLSVTVDRLKRKYGRYNKRNITMGSDVANSTRSSDSVAQAETPKSKKLPKFRRC
jgi:hypothetical protein